MSFGCVDAIWGVEIAIARGFGWCIFVLFMPESLPAAKIILTD